MNWSTTALLLTALVPAQAVRLRIAIQDENAKPVAARVYLADQRGEPVFPPNTIHYEKVRSDGIGERHFVPSGGAFVVDLAAGRYQLNVERGKEYLPQTLRISVPSSGEVRRTVRLRRWVDMPRRGWFPG